MAETATKEVEKTAETTATEPASTQEPKDKGVETNEADDTASSEAPKSEPTEPVDYKAEFDRVSKQLEQAEHVIVDTKKKLKDKTIAPASDPADDTEFATAEELTKNIETSVRTQLQAEFEEREARLRADFRADVIAEELTALTTNPDEQRLIQLHYDKTIRPTGLSRQAIRQDLRRARLLANESRLTRENEELKEALKAKNSTGPASAATNQERTEPEDEPKMTPQERALLARRAAAQGISTKEFIRRNRSKLTN